MKKITDNEFEIEVLKSSKVVLVDAYATWCGPCKMLTPVLEELQEMTQEWLDIVKIDVDESDKIVETLKITGIPALFIYKNGKLLDSALGYKNLEELKSFVEQYK